MGSDEFPHIKSKKIFPIPVSGGYLVYAPLANSCFGAGRDDLARLESILEAGGGQHPGFDDILALVDESENFSFGEMSPFKLTGMSILPTWNCNFNCTYCYAAKAHRKKDIPLPLAYRAMDFFFFSSMGSGEVALQVLGGGEPFTRWELVRNIAAYARECEKKYNRPLTLSVATNGSVLDDGMIDDIVRLDMRLSFSFEVLRDVQDLQRGAWSVVHRNLVKLVDAGLSDRIFIRTIITKANVGRLDQILDAVKRNYPDVCGVIAEPVMGMDNFDSTDDYARFCDDFARDFRRVRSIALEEGINFTTMILRNVDFSINYGCEGDFCVTPDGMISICHRLASPAEGKIMSGDNYGSVSLSEVMVDTARYKEILGAGVDSRDGCKDCFAKYNCGGGCIARNISETAESKEIYCNLVRTLLKDELQRRFIDLQK